MGRTRAAADLGFTLIELVIAVAIVATSVAAGFGISLASRSFAVSAAATEFDQLLDSARTIARELEGATLAFAPDAYGDGTEVRLLARDANGAFSPTTVPTLHARASFEETESLGKAPFAFIVHANGSLSGRANYRPGDATGSGEVGCPASGAFHFVIRAAGVSAERYVPCRVKLAASGPVALVTWPAAPIAASPTPCSTGSCAATSLPSPPVSTPTCPANFTPIPGGCAPIPALNAEPRYHVTISGAPATMIVGTTSSFTAQATLTNPTAVPPGTPSTIPVSIQSTTNNVCAAAPPGWQQSGSSFTLTALAPGTCAVTIQADSAVVLDASADTATVSVSIAAQSKAPPTSSPPTCDLSENGKCYHRIAGPLTQRFYKDVYPDYSCRALVDDNSCWYVDSIREIDLYYNYSFHPPEAPVDASRELRFQIDAVTSAERACLPYSAFFNVPAGSSISWGGTIVGGPVQPPLGLGEPSVYLRVNHIVLSASNGSGAFTESGRDSPQTTSLLGLYGSVASRRIGAPYSFSYSSAEANNQYINWYPDFPGCDSDSDFAGIQYGSASVDLLFEIYQRVP